MSRGWIWAQLAAAWVAVWALFSALMMNVHELPLHVAAVGALQIVAAAAVLSPLVYRFTLRHPWPHPFRSSFALFHAAGAIAFSVVWIALISVIRSVMIGQPVIAVGPGFTAFVTTGIWLYLIVAGVLYANQAARRAGELEAHAARAQLAALRAQVHPHFLFNALHTVVQLIPTDPRGAMRAAEELAGALRASIDEQRDRVPLAEEWRFVERYLAIENIRFGDRLQVEARIAPPAGEALLPSFALQTFVENAVRHGAAPRMEATRITIDAEVDSGELHVTVRDDGVAAAADFESRGSGLRRLRERLQWLYGGRARLELDSPSQGGFTARLIVPLEHDG